MTNDNTAVLLIHCPDRPGILAAVTDFINQQKGNILYLDQYVNREDHIFFMRVEWALDNFIIPRDEIEDYIDTLLAKRYSMEQLAANAERASIKYKQVEFMSERLGQVFDGVISGVSEWGIYVQLNENKCEGMIPIRDLDDDYYIFDEKNYCLEGHRFKKKFQLGDAITVQVARANLDKKQLDFALVRDGEEKATVSTMPLNPRKESRSKGKSSSVKKGGRRRR